MKDVCISSIEKSVIHNDFYEIPKVEKALTYLEKNSNSPDDLPEKLIDFIIKKNNIKPIEAPENLTKIILENKFIDLKWEIVFDDLSSLTKDISQIKIMVKIIYLNLATLKKESIIFVLKENEFRDLMVEIGAIQKNL